MQAADLKFPGDLNGSIRREVAFAISNLESVQNRGGTPDPHFAAFLADAAAKTPGYVGVDLPDTQVVVTDAQALTIRNSTRSHTASAVAEVQDGSLNEAVLAPTVALVGNGGLATGVTVTGTGTTATFTVAGGVITAITLSNPA